MESETYNDELDWDAGQANYLFGGPSPEQLEGELDALLGLETGDFPAFNPDEFTISSNFTAIRDNYLPGPPSAFTASDSWNDFDALSTYSSQFSHPTSHGGQEIPGIDMSRISICSKFEAVDEVQQVFDSFTTVEPPQALNPSTIFPGPPSLRISTTDVPSSLLPDPVSTPTGLKAPSDIPDPVAARRTKKRTRVDEHDPQKMHSCPHCPRRFDRRWNLKTHMDTHEPRRDRPFKCDFTACQSAFSRKHDLQRHIESKHEGKASKPQQLWCDDCGHKWTKGSASKCECSGT